MEEREPGFFTGLHVSDFMGIGIAFLFSLGGLYLAWRLMFGPPLTMPPSRPRKGRQTQEAPLTPQPDIHTGPAKSVSASCPSPTKKH